MRTRLNGERRAVVSVIPFPNLPTVPLSPVGPQCLELDVAARTFQCKPNIAENQLQVTSAPPMAADTPPRDLPDQLCEDVPPKPLQHREDRGKRRSWACNWPWLKFMPWLRNEV